MNALETPARPISAELGAVLLDTLGLAESLEWHARRFQKRTGVVYELTVSRAAAFDLPEDHAATLLDIYNEALSNVARRARASRVAIALTIRPDEVTVVVSDNGIGTTVTVSLPLPVSSMTPCVPPRTG